VNEPMTKVKVLLQGNPVLGSMVLLLDKHKRVSLKYGTIYGKLDCNGNTPEECSEYMNPARLIQIQMATIDCHIFVSFGVILADIIFSCYRWGSNPLSRRKGLTSNVCSLFFFSPISYVNSS